MRIHFKRFELISAPKPYGITFIREKNLWLIKANTPKWLYGIGISF
jgi:hypothetical protein